MKYKRIVSVLMALSLVLIANISQDKTKYSTNLKAINSDLIWLSISSFKNTASKNIQKRVDIK